MDQHSLVIEAEEIAAGAGFVSLFDKKIPVTAAFWVKPVEAGQWYPARTWTPSRSS
jgi:hypothetical protein